jgi:hypothetical protein
LPWAKGNSGGALRGSPFCGRAFDTKYFFPAGILTFVAQAPDAQPIFETWNHNT